MKSICVFLFLSLIAVSLFADDVQGSKDHPMISRYAGSRIIAYDERIFDSLRVATGPSYLKDQKWVFKTSQTVEGKLTRVLYVAPEGRSPLEVFRNYTTELTNAGFQTIFSCAGEDCGQYFSTPIYKDRRLENGGELSYWAFNFPKDQQYLAAKATTPDGDVYVSLYVALETFDQFPETAKHSLTLLEVAETKAMQSGMVTVNADVMKTEIQKSGHVALYGIYFDTGKAEVKPDSKPALEQIAVLLQQNADLKLLVVGHTDNVGDYDSNLALSQKRADAVVQSLVQGGIDAKRLRPAGVGFLAPVASNDSETGRSKNRRVELVRQ